MDFFRDGLGNPPAYTGVHFVKDDGGDILLGRKILFIASITLESSPPEATFDSGFKGSPVFVEIKNFTRSIPFG